MYVGAFLKNRQTSDDILNQLKRGTQLFLMQLSNYSNSTDFDIYIRNLDSRIQRNLVVWLHWEGQGIDNWFKYLVERYDALPKSSNSLVFSFENEFMELNSHEIRPYLEALVQKWSNPCIMIPVRPGISSWQIWNENLKVPGLNVAISIDESPIDDNTLQYWSTEPISLILHNSGMVEHGIKSTASLLKMLNRSLPVFLSESSPSHYLERLKYIKVIPTYNLMIEPLQPLRDDLFSIVYSEFEKDENKYEQYKSAMELALNDIKEEAPEQPIKILFVGPGHGKLIDKLMELLQEFTYNIKIFAYEKNQICTQTLHDKNVRFWNNQVHLTMADVRDVESIVIPDILVSEMLGSFGDNEGCPEILSRFNSPGCRPRIMIPQSYTSYLQPIYTPIEVPSNTRPYLVNLTRFYEVDEPTSVWTWEHPSSQLETREMSKELVFHNNSHGRRISGFYGYFTSNLYGHVSISINRIDVDRSNFCSSWYPIYFPVKAARLEKGEGITFTINRYNDGKKVWYQWNYRGYTYNEDGAGYTIEL